MGEADRLQIFCTGRGRHEKTFATSRVDGCYCGADWEAEEVALRNAQIQSVRQRHLQGNLLAEEQTFLADLRRDFLASAASGPSELSDDHKAALRTALVAEWSQRFALDPDDEQAAAIATEWRDAVVEARAGSGKTRTIIGRALFLIDHCGLPSDSVLILAFNRRAADEIKSRLRTSGIYPLPHVMTFHALSRRIVQPTEKLLDDILQTELIDEIVKDFFSSEVNEQRVRDLLKHRFKRDDARAAEELLFRSKSEYIDYRLSVPFVTLAGEIVKSYGEQQIANLLFRYDVEYHYEQALPLRIGGATYRPDFTIPPREPNGKTVVIEYFGMGGNRGYDRLISDKRDFWAVQDPKEYAFLEYRPADVKRGDEFGSRFLTDLHEVGVRTEKLEADEVWRRTKKGAVLSISEALRGFTQQARKRGWDAKAAREAVAAHVAMPGVLGELESAFLELALEVFEAYLQAIISTNQIDFDELVNRAASLVSGGQTSFVGTREDPAGDIRRVRAVLIDEFQDFNAQFESLLAATRSAMHNPTFFVVGDPWQAINAFAGASTRFFTSFTADYPGAARHVISTNYRSARRIVQVGNAIMRDRPETPARPVSEELGFVRVFDGSQMEPDPAGKAGSRGLNLEQQSRARLVRAAWELVPDDAGLFVFSRTSHVASDVELSLKKHLTRQEMERISFSSVHQSKGLEAEYIVLLDAGPSMFPLIHPNWIFGRIFGDNVDDIVRDEQNLLYVAITRAAKEAWVLVRDGIRTPFLPVEGSRYGLTAGAWVNAPPLSTYGMTRISVDGYEYREELKSHGFRFDATAKRWIRYLASIDDALALLREVQPGGKLSATVSSPESEVELVFDHRNWPQPSAPT